MNDQKKLCVSMVTYHAAELTLACLASIREEFDRLDFPCRVVVSDNGSTDGSEETIQRAIDERGWSSWVTFLQTGRNGGFAFGQNSSLRHDLESDDPADYYLLINPDTLVRPGCFGKLVEFLESHPEVGLAGSRSEDPDGTPQPCSFRFPGMISECLDYLRLGILDRLLHRHLTRMEIRDEAHEVDWVSGASVIVRREVFEQIGLMDDEFFLYFEETDFILRARRAGWTCWHVPESRLVHHVGQTTGIVIQADSEQRKRRPGFWFDSRRRYFLKNYGLARTLLIDAAAVLGLTLWQARRLLQGKKDVDPPCYYRDFVRQSTLNFLDPRGLRPRQPAPRYRGEPLVSDQPATTLENRSQPRPEPGPSSLPSSLASSSLSAISEPELSGAPTEGDSNEVVLP